MVAPVLYDLPPWADIPAVIQFACQHPPHHITHCFNRSNRNACYKIRPISQNNFVLFFSLRHKNESAKRRNHFSCFLEKIDKNCYMYPITHICSASPHPDQRRVELYMTPFVQKILDKSSESRIKTPGLQYGESPR